jgi:hypothetical protein
MSLCQYRDGITEVLDKICIPADNNHQVYAAYERSLER